MNEQEIQDILVALLTEDSVQLGERGTEGAEPTFEAVSTLRTQGGHQTIRGWQSARATGRYSWSP